MTTQKQIDAARNIALQISQFEGLSACQVDDWSDYGCFRLFAGIKGRTLYANLFLYDNTVNMKKIIPFIKKVIKENGAIMEIITSPKAVYETAQQYSKGKRFLGHNSDEITIDLRLP